MAEKDKYAGQKKHLATQKQLRVWMSPEKFEALKAKAAQNCTSVYALVNQWIDRYLEPET